MIRRSALSVLLVLHACSAPPSLEAADVRSFRIEHDTRQAHAAQATFVVVQLSNTRKPALYIPLSTTADSARLELLSGSGLAYADSFEPDIDTRLSDRFDDEPSQRFATFQCPITFYPPLDTLPDSAGVPSVEWVTPAPNERVRVTIEYYGLFGGVQQSGNSLSVVELQQQCLAPEFAIENPR